MTVSITNSRNRYEADGVQTIFPYTFRVFTDSQLVVTVEDVVQVLGTDYTMTNTGNETGGNVTFITLPANPVIFFA